jgi:FG-GAP-like repeat
MFSWRVGSTDGRANSFLLQRITPVFLGVVVLFSRGTATAQQFTEVDPGLPKSANPCVIWGDYDGDGDLDLLVAGVGKQDVAYATIYRNNSGVFSNSGISLLGLSRATAAWGDFDNDGDLDLAMTGLTTAGVATTWVYRNDGGVFTPVPGNFTGVFAGSVTWADYDGDGDLDLLVTGVTSSTAGAPAVTRLYRNDGGVFTSVPHPFPDCYVGAVAWGDYDNDGDLDVVITGATSTGALVAGLWRNDGGGKFTDAGVNLPGMDLGFAAWGDYDNDGNLDLLYGGNSSDGWITRIYHNTGGALTNLNAELLGLIWSSAAWGDYDNDGDLDFMVIGYDPVAQVRRSSLYRNDGGTFVDSGATFHNLLLGTVGWADYDNDGKLDLLVAGNELGLDILSIYHNNNATSNTVPTPPANLSANVIGASVDFSWSPGSDAQTPTAGLTYNLRIGTSPGGSEIMSPQSSSAGYRRLPEMGNGQSGLTARVANLKPGTNYYWSVQAVDTAFAGSAFAVEGNFIALADPPVGVSFVREGLDGVRATWRGTPGTSYQVLASSNLLNWDLMATPTAASDGLFDILDSTSTAPTRFYRAVRP